MMSIDMFSVQLTSETIIHVGLHLSYYDSFLSV